MAGGRRFNLSRRSSRDGMRRQGEDIKGKMPPGGEPPKEARRKVSKAELREQAEAAFRAWRSAQTAKNN